MLKRNVTFLRAAVLLALLAFPLLAIQPAHAAQIPADRFQTTPTMRDETRNLLNYLENSHYLRLKLDSIAPAELVDEYLQSLDHKHLYFTERDVQEATQKYAPIIQAQLTKGQLDPAFALFLEFRRRVQERVQWVFLRLEQPFNFEDDSSYEPDRSKAPWPVNGKELGKLWEQQLKYELLNELLSELVPNKDSEETEDETTLITVTPETPAKATRGAEAASEETVTTVTEEITPPTLEEALEKAIATVRKRYEREVQWVGETEPEEVQEIFLTTLSRLYDPHSTFMSSTTMEEFSMAIRNSLVGIGAVLSDEDGYCTIRELLPGGPADQSGKLKPKDQIVGVAQGKDGEMVDVIGMRLRKIVKMIRGPKGTDVRLLVRPAGGDPSERVTVNITRDEVKLTEQLAQAQLYSLPMAEGQESLKIGVIHLPAFYGSSQSGADANNTTADVAELIKKLKQDGMQALVLDLRNNGGGLLGEAISLTGLFLPQGPVVQVRNSRGQVQDYRDEDPNISWDGPLAVLVSRFSASASEIAAGALRDNNRALIIGDEATHGKGTVQAVFDMNRQNFFSIMRSTNRGAAKITVQKYYLPGGDSTQINGVRTDIALPSFNKYLPVGEGDLPNAMAHDAIDPVRWDSSRLAANNISEVTPELIETLRKTSLQRQDTLPEFSYLKSNIDFLRRKQDEKKLSLNFDGRLSQRQQDKAFREKMSARFKELSKDSYTFEKVLLDAALRQKAEHDELLAARAANKAASKEPAEDGTTAADDDAQAAANTGEGEQPASDKVAAKDTADGDDKKDKPRLDIHLQETLRVMSDWLTLLDGAAPSPDTTPELVKNATVTAATAPAERAGDKAPQP